MLSWEKVDNETPRHEECQLHEPEQALLVAK